MKDKPPPLEVRFTNSGNWILRNRIDLIWLYQIALIGTSMALLYLYRTGGPIDGPAQPGGTLSLRDYNVWVQAGKHIFEGLDPYLKDSILKSGTFSSTFIYLLSLMIPSKYAFFMFMQFLNIVGLIYFLKIFIGLSPERYILVFLCLTFSSTREILVNGQTTGIIFGLLALIFYAFSNLSSTQDFSNKTKFILLSSSAFSIAFIVDIKPNLVIFPIAILAIYFRRRSPLLFALIIWVAHQTIVSLNTGTFLIKSWFTNLTSVTTYEINPTLFGSLGPWQLLNGLNLPNSIMEYGPLSTFIICGLMAIHFALRRDLTNAIILAFASNYLYSYFHYYSFLPFLAYLTVRVLAGNSLFFAGFFISSMQFSFNKDGVSITLASIMMLLLLVIAFRFESMQKSLFFIVGWLSYLVLKQIIFISFESNDLFAKSLVIFIAVMTSLIAGGDINARKKSFENR